MKCPNCGCETGESKFCSNCGTPMTPAKQPKSSTPYQPPQDVHTQSQPTHPTQHPYIPTQEQPSQQTADQPYVSQNPQPYQQPYQQNPQYPYYQQPLDTGPWYGKTWVIIIFLLLFWPVGIIFMWMKTCSWSKAVKIIVTALIALSMVICIGAAACTTAAVMHELENGNYNITATDNGINISISGNENNANTGSNANSNMANPPSVHTEPITLEMVSQTSGSQMTSWLDNADYVWLASMGGWGHDNGIASFAVAGENGILDPTAVNQLMAAGKGTPVIYAFNYETNESIEDVIASQPVVKEDIYIEDDDSAMVVFYGPNMIEMLAIITVSNGEANFAVANNEACESGLFAETLKSRGNSAQPQKSIAEWWQESTGYPVGEYIQAHPIS